MYSTLNSSISTYLPTLLHIFLHKIYLTRNFLILCSFSLRPFDNVLFPQYKLIFLLLVGAGCEMSSVLSAALLHSICLTLGIANFNSFVILFIHFIICSSKSNPIEQNLRHPSFIFYKVRGTDNIDWMITLSTYLKLVAHNKWNLRILKLIVITLRGLPLI